MLHALRSAQKTYERRILELGPIAFFPLTDPSGAVATDISGNARHGSYTGGTLASGVIRGKPAWTANGTDAAHVNIYSAALNAAWPRTPITAGTVLIWGAFTGTWSEAAQRYIYRLYQSGTDKVSLSKVTANKITWEHIIGNVSNDFGFRMKTSHGTTPFCIATSWDSVAGKTKYYLDGALLHTTTGTQIWGAGNLSASTTLLARSGTAGANYWPGPLGYCAIFDKALTDAQIALVSCTQLEAPVSYPDGFSIVQLSDIMQTSDSWVSSRWESLQAMNWIIANQARYNIQAVIYTGDIVETEATAAEWTAAAAAADLIANTEIPYHFCAGNHDYSDVPTRVKANFDANFTQAKYTGHAWFNGAFYEANKSENAYWTFRLSGVDYIILDLELAPRALVETWANGILTTHSDKKALVFTHQFMDENGTRYNNEGVNIWNNILKLHDNVVLVGCGHGWLGDTSHRTDNSDGGKPINQSFYNGHDMYPHLRMYTIRPSAGKIMVQTYDHTRQKLWNAPGMQFEFALP